MLNWYTGYRKTIFPHYFLILSGTVFVPQYLKTAQAVLVKIVTTFILSITSLTLTISPPPPRSFQIKNYSNNCGVENGLLLTFATGLLLNSNFLKYEKDDKKLKNLN
jgi:hypothetical protein